MPMKQKGHILIASLICRPRTNGTAVPVSMPSSNEYIKMYRSIVCVRVLRVFFF